MERTSGRNGESSSSTYTHVHRHVHTCPYAINITMRRTQDSWDGIYKAGEYVYAHALHVPIHMCVRRSNLRQP